METRPEELKNTDGIFDEQVGTGTSKECKWRYGGYYIAIAIKEFFCGKTRPKRGHDTFTSVAETIVANFSESGDIQEGLLKSTKELLHQQRMLEDTHARRRLERWATRVIAWYLIIVLIVVVLNSIVSAVADIEGGFISGGIMAAILTTTTVNIIGLGLIVLKGHFPNNQKRSVEEKDK